ncbi:hypothetical protein AC578_1744 [Pseudocercospora eumusae]|uniref:Uncharacterized protein n=1 Tax=Pseudocercospora eumusae TaxID=321146 RepID=A0A139GUV4_9PEZI|nr:hypothetical protein AC578_1744 [Pseudocercospora eumusae]KXS93943.1 hypothetical protein AC578_1744 [Pseudocercospora eumusae]KXS93944.1 hypothetical protein AC578_1744 [Pseudocercospora eumusae]KXS93946.1 hypothetical protein AC578_1744 [Pseudocercospora eumusae]
MAGERNRIYVFDNLGGVAFPVLMNPRMAWEKFCRRLGYCTCENADADSTLDEKCSRVRCRLFGVPLHSEAELFRQKILILLGIVTKPSPRLRCHIHGMLGTRLGEECRGSDVNNNHNKMDHHLTLVNLCILFSPAMPLRKKSKISSSSSSSQKKKNLDQSSSSRRKPFLDLGPDFAHEMRLSSPLPPHPAVRPRVDLPELEGSTPAPPPSPRRRVLADNGLLQSQHQVSSLILRRNRNRNRNVEVKRQSGIYYGRNLDPSLLSLATGNLRPKWWRVFGCFRGA